MTGDKRRRLRAVVLALSLAMATGGCFRARFVNGTGSAPAPTATYEWYLSLVWAIDLRGPVSFAEVCPGGDWVELRMLWGPIGAFVSAITGTILVPQTTTVVCPGGYRVEGTAAAGKMTSVSRVYAAPESD